MIDYVSMNKIMPISKRTFKPTKWHREVAGEGDYYWYRFRGVTIRYYFETQRLLIMGKLITLLHDTQVQNFDDIYGGETDLFLDELNDFINGLFTQRIVDVREFSVTRIDYCFNVETSFVKDYLAFLRQAFQMVSTGAKTDFAAKNGVDGSVYIKNSSEYAKNSRYNYTLNVYDKLDRLHYQQEKGQNISAADLALAENTLRIEVQASHNLIKSVCRHFGMEKTFVNLFNYPVAVYTIESVLKRVYRMDKTMDFYTYQEAKKKVKVGSAAAEALYALATNHRVNGEKYIYKCKQVAKVGIYPYCLLRKESAESILKNPITLIHEKDGLYL